MYRNLESNAAKYFQVSSINHSFKMSNSFVQIKNEYSDDESDNSNSSTQKNSKVNKSSFDEIPKQSFHIDRAYQPKENVQITLYFGGEKLVDKDGCIVDLSKRGAKLSPSMKIYIPPECLELPMVTFF